MDNRLTPPVRSLLSATYQGRVSMVCGSGVVLLRPGAGGEPINVTQTFLELMRHRWAFVVPFEEVEPPAETPCYVTSAGEDALAEATAAKRKTGKR